MRSPADLWKLRARTLEQARKAARRGAPEGLHDLRVALRRAATTAQALHRKGLARNAKLLSRSLSQPRQLEVDRRLLARVGQLGFLSPDASTALAARWDKLASRGERVVVRAAERRRMERLLGRLDRLSRKKARRLPERLEKARRRMESTLALPLDGKDDATLHHYRMTVKKARYLAEDLAAIGLSQWTKNAERERVLQETLGRWNDLRLFRRRLKESLDEAEQRGAVTLAGELGRLLAALEPAIASARRAAVEASHHIANVVPIERAARA